MALTWAEVVRRVHINTFNVIYIFGMYGLVLAVSCFCWRRGDRTDRLVAVTFSGCWLGSLIVMWWSGIVLDDIRPPISWWAAWGVGTASAFLYAAIRRQSSWYALAAAAQGVQMAGRVVDQVLHEAPGPVYYSLLVVFELQNLVMMGAMTGAVLTAKPAGRSLRRGSAEQRTDVWA